MPELPEVEILVRHLRPLLPGKTIRGVAVRRAKVVGPASPRRFQKALAGAKFLELSRRGKFLLFMLRAGTSGKPMTLLGHLGMTGRMYMAPKSQPLPRHAAVVFDLGRQHFIYEDTRYFGRMTLDLSVVAGLGPEPLGQEFDPAAFFRALKRSRQAVKVKLLDQSLVAGVGNIYASEALFRAGISPKLPSNRLTLAQAKRLWTAIRDVLAEAIAGGSTVPLKFAGGKADGLFYFGRAPGAPEYYVERLRAYDRAGEPCVNCGCPIKRIVQAARAHFIARGAKKGDE